MDSPITVLVRLAATSSWPVEFAAKDPAWVAHVTVGDKRITLCVPSNEWGKEIRKCNEEIDGLLGRHRDAEWQQKEGFRACWEIAETEENDALLTKHVVNEIINPANVMVDCENKLRPFYRRLADLMGEHKDALKIDLDINAYASQRAL